MTKRTSQKLYKQASKTGKKNMLQGQKNLNSTSTFLEFKSFLKHQKEIVETFLKKYFEKKYPPQVLHEAMTYSLFAGGKRIRPILCLASYQSCNKNIKDILPQACALELIHTFSLIHDDLPAIDNDDLRRGKLTNHKKFGEAIAIMAGDGLLVEAFQMFLQTNKITPNILLNALKELTNAIGREGLVAGETADIIYENKEPDKQTLQFIHFHKTAIFIQASVKIGAILANANQEVISALECYGKNIGMAFQIIDDILDITQTSEQLGKPQGSDLKKKKMTYPALFGLKESEKMALNHIEKAVFSLKSINNSFYLEQLAFYLKNRIN